jgi:hypothetical protein
MKICVPILVVERNFFTVLKTVFVWLHSFFFLKDLKLKFYRLMIELDQHDGSYLAVCKHYLAIYNTQCIKDDAQKCKEVINA